MYFPVFNSQKEIYSVNIIKSPFKRAIYIHCAKYAPIPTEYSEVWLTVRITVFEAGNWKWKS